MNTERKVICNKAGKYDCCKHCSHSQPHNPIDYPCSLCTTSDLCWYDDAKSTRVKCIIIKIETK